MANPPKTYKRATRGLPLDDDDYFTLDNLPVVPAAQIFTNRIKAYKEMLKKPIIYSECVEPPTDEKKLVPTRKQPSRKKKQGSTPELEFVDICVSEHSNSECDSPATPAIELSKAAVKRINRLKNKIRRDRAKYVFPQPSNMEFNAALDSDEEVLCLEEEKSSEIIIKICYRREIFRIPIRKNDKFAVVFPEIARRCEANISEILLFLKNRTITLEDTPEKLGLTAADIIDCCIWNPASRNDSSVPNQDCINVKIQSNDSKIKTKLSIHKLDPLSVLMKQYAEKRNLPLEKLKFEFDGEKINPTQNPMDLDMENDSCIDVRIV